MMITVKTRNKETQVEETFEMRVGSSDVACFYKDQYSVAVSELVAEMGIGGAFQDSDGTAYQTAECEGKFVYFDKFEVKRTRRAGERAGSLSLKAAKELGFSVKE